MNTNEKLNEIESLIREIYKTNEGPKLINELLREFPSPRGPRSQSNNTPMCHALG